MSEWQPIETAPKMRTIMLFAVTSTDPPNWKMATGFLRKGYQGEPDAWEWDGRRVDA